MFGFVDMFWDLILSSFLLVLMEFLFIFFLFSYKYLFYYEEVLLYFYNNGDFYIFNSKINVKWENFNM